MQSRDTVVAVFHDRDDAQDAINALRDAGFMSDDVSILARDRDVAGRLADDTGTEAAAGAATGALAGGLLGGVAGWLVGIGALAIPGVGPIIAAGPIAAALGGAALGAASGGIIGALTGAGVPEDEARYYDDEFRRGGIVVTVQARGRYDEARRIMHEYGGMDATRGTATYSSWNETSPRFRSAYEQRYGTSRRWEDVEPAHRFGYESYGQTRAERHHDRLAHPRADAARRSGAAPTPTVIGTPIAMTCAVAGTTVVAGPPSATTTVTTSAPRARTLPRPAVVRSLVAWQAARPARSSVVRLARRPAP